MGKMNSGVCVCVKEKRLELSTPNFLHIYSMAGSWHALTMRSKGQGHTAMKCAAGMGVHASMTVWVYCLVFRGVETRASISGLLGDIKEDWESGVQKSPSGVRCRVL